MTFSITAIRMMPFSIATINKMTLSMMTSGLTTLSLMSLLIINKNTILYIIMLSATYAELAIKTILLCVLILNVIMVSVAAPFIR